MSASKNRQTLKDRLAVISDLVSLCSVSPPFPKLSAGNAGPFEVLAKAVRSYDPAEMKSDKHTQSFVLAGNLTLHGACVSRLVANPTAWPTGAQCG